MSVPAFSLRRWRYFTRRVRRSTVFAGLACASAIGGALFADWVVGQLLEDRDRLRSAYEAEARVSGECLLGWQRTIDRGNALVDVIEEHEQIESESVCSCWTPEPIVGLVGEPSSTSLLSRSERAVP